MKKRSEPVYRPPTALPKLTEASVGLRASSLLSKGKGIPRMTVPKPVAPSKKCGVKGEILAVARKYREEETAKVLSGFAKFLQQENIAKERKMQDLDKIRNRMLENLHPHVKRQLKIKLDDDQKVAAIEELVKRIKLENSCLNLEKMKLRLEIHKLRAQNTRLMEQQQMAEEEAEQITSADRYANYHPDFGVTFGPSRHLAMKTIENEPVLDCYVQNPPLSSPTPERAEGIVVQEKELQVVEDEQQAHQDLMAITFGPRRPRVMPNEENSHSRLLSRIKMRHIRPDSKRALRNIVNSVHNDGQRIRSGFVSDSTSQVSLERPAGRENRDQTSPKPKGLHLVKNGSVSVSRFGIGERSEANLSHLESRFIGTRYEPTSKGSPFSVDFRRMKGAVKADTLHNKIDDIAKKKFGNSFIDVVAVMAKINEKLLKVDKKIKKRGRHDRKIALIVLNFVLCFKKAFLVLKIKQGLVRATKVVSKVVDLAKIEPVAPAVVPHPIEGELTDTLHKLVALENDMVRYLMEIVSPAAPPKAIEPLKVSPYITQFQELVNQKQGQLHDSEEKRIEQAISHSPDKEEEDDKDSGFISWTPNKMAARSEIDEGARMRINSVIDESMLSSPSRSSPHLLSLEPKILKKKIFDTKKYRHEVENLQQVMNTRTMRKCEINSVADTKIEEEPQEKREDYQAKPSTVLKRKRVIELYSGEDRESVSREASFMKKGPLTPLQSHCSTKNSPKNGLFMPFFRKPVFFPSNPNLSVSVAGKKPTHRSQLSCNSKSGLTQGGGRSQLQESKTMEVEKPKEVLEENRDYLMEVLNKKPMVGSAATLMRKLKVEKGTGLSSRTNTQSATGPLSSKTALAHKQRVSVALNKYKHVSQAVLSKHK